MSIGSWAFVIAIVLIAAQSLKPYSRKLQLSTSVIVVVCGVLFSLVINAFNIDTGLRWGGLSNLILQLLLPLMVYAGACRLNRANLYQNHHLTLFLVVPGLVLSVLICAVGLYYALIWVQPIPFALALLAAFILSASDPFCLSDYFQPHKKSWASLKILEKESVFTDTIVVLGYTFLSLYTLGNLDEWTSGQSIMYFLGNILGELAIGGTCAAIGWQLMRHNHEQIFRQLMGIACALLALGLCQSFLATGGLLAIFMVGLVVSDVESRQTSHDHNLSFLLEYLCSVLILALLGLSFTSQMFVDNYLAMIVGAVVVLLTRGIIILLTPKKWLGEVDKRWLFIGYSQCAIPAAIALSLSTEIEQWYLIQSMVYGVAVMTLLLRGPACALWLKHQYQ